VRKNDTRVAGTGGVTLVKPLDIRRLGTLSYDEGLALQARLVEERRADLQRAQPGDRGQTGNQSGPVA
jgi:hypothetical protein